MAPKQKSKKKKKQVHIGFSRKPRRISTLGFGPKSSKPLMTPRLVPKDFSDSNSSNDDSDQGRMRRLRMRNAEVASIPYRKRQDFKDKKIPVPMNILKVTQEKFDKAMAFLEAPTIPKETRTLCTDSTFTLVAQRGIEPFEYLMSDNYMFQEMLNCLEKNDLDGFMGTASGAYSTRKCPDIRRYMLLAACYALFYHPAAKDEEVFQRCMEGIFKSLDKKRVNITIDHILRTIMSAYDVEEEEE